MAVGAAHREGAGAVRAPEVGACDVGLEVGRVVVAVKILEIIYGVRALALSFENSDPGGLT